MYTSFIICCNFEAISQLLLLANLEKEKTLHFPVPKDINPKSGFTIPPGALEKPPIPDTLSGKSKDIFL